MTRACAMSSVLFAAFWSVAIGAQVTIVLPPDTATFRPSTLPGYELVRQNCALCHSAEYVLTQPPMMPRTYWEATVRKMKKPFGAPFPDADVPAMVDYLVKAYGAER